MLFDPRKDKRTTETDPVDVLMRARMFIDLFGWTSGNWEDDGAACPFLVIVRQFTPEARQRGEGDRALTFFARAIGVPYIGEIMDWNKAPGRTKEDVLQAFDDAMVLAKAEASR